MAVFGKTSLGNESSYNAGFSLVSYIATHYGVDKLAKISRRLSAPFRITIDGAIKEVLGKKVIGVKDYDGVKLDLEDDSWIMVRASGTEPILRAYAESKSPKRTIAAGFATSKICKPAA